MYDLEHPEITCALQTGFPSWKQKTPPKCELCGYELYLDEMYEDEEFYEDFAQLASSYSSVKTIYRSKKRNKNY